MRRSWIVVLVALAACGGTGERPGSIVDSVGKPDAQSDVRTILDGPPADLTAPEVPGPDQSAIDSVPPDQRADTAPPDLAPDAAPADAPSPDLPPDATVPDTSPDLSPDTAPPDLAPDLPPDSPPNVVIPPCSRLILRGNDGVFLGVATGNSNVQNGVCNPFSQHGNKISPTSIFNPFSMYGSQFSTVSAYNPFTATPPRLECEATGAKHNPVTKSQLPLQRIDPDALCATLSSMGR
jgi:hypothetical protein